ncbi:MAG: single-stranded DNA-binding protein [Candidatus Gastranaerophilales bacterium]|nr:single-stranded DNA-binding protein [Candidatus Gastranaerophilales bacterium]
MNSAVLVGRVGQDPEIKYFESGKARTTFSIAVDRWNAKTKQREADWFNIQLWDKRAESAANYIKKGSMVSVEGRITVSKWQAPDGEMVERYVINATDFGFVGSKKDAIEQ